MSQVNLERSPEEVAEIEKHKYFLSEQAGYDIGWQAAEQDWETNYAEQFRQSANCKSKPQSGGGMGTFIKRVLAKAGAR